MKSGFSFVELLVGLAILAFVVAAGSAAMRPLNQANTRYRLTQKAQQLEKEIRRGIYYQSAFSGPAGVQIKINDVVVAQENKVLFVREDLASAVETLDGNLHKKEDYPFVTRISLVDNGVGGWGLLYQISSTTGKLVSTYGLRNWPDNPGDYFKGNIHESSAVTVPAELVASIKQGCSEGFLRGIVENNSRYSPICWSFAPVTKPAWSLPTSFALDSANSTITIAYSPLNKPRCGPLTIRTNDNRTYTLPNFYAFAKLDLSDLFPAKAAGVALASECELIVDFKKSSSSGMIPASVVDDASVNKKPGACPDKNLYTQAADRSCSLNFNLQDVESVERSPATVSP